MKKWSIITAFWLLLWQGLAMLVDNVMLLPGPIDTIVALGKLISDSSFYLDVLATIGRTLSGLVLSLVLGVLLAVMAYKWHIVKDVLSLPISFFKTIPVMAVAIYMILLMSAGSVPVLVCWVMCFPIVYTNMLTGLDSMDEKLLEMSVIYDITGLSQIRYVYLPSLFPHFKSAINLVSGMSWKAIVTAEVLSIPRFSLGYELMNAKYYLTTENLFAYVAVIILISYGFERLIKWWLEKSAPRPYEKSKVKGRRPLADYNGQAASVRLVNVSKAFGDKQVQTNFSLALEPGKTTAIMGASGRGKTTIARLIAGLEHADAGEVKVDGQRISFLFQEDRLLPWLNVYDNLAIVNPDPSKILEVLKAVGLESDQWKLPGELSGGMSYRVAMARAFLYNAGLLIADEPFRGLDEETRESVIAGLWNRGIEHKTVLLITHSQSDADELADKVVTI